MTPGRWWAKRWLQAMAVKGISRGRTLARGGHVLSCDFAPGRVAARVQGPCEVRLLVDAFDEMQWRRVLDGLTRRPTQAARLLAGEMPSDLADLFADAGLSLLPRGGVSATCSCRSSDGSCEHVAAVTCVAADALAEDPFGLLVLRGRTRGQLLAALRGAPTATVLPADPSLFYATPSLDGFEVDVAAPLTEAVLARLGAPGDWPAFADALAPAYEAIALQASRLMGR